MFDGSHNYACGDIYYMSDTLCRLGIHPFFIGDIVDTTICACKRWKRLSRYERNGT